MLQGFAVINKRLSSGGVLTGKSQNVVNGSLKTQFGGVVSRK